MTILTLNRKEFEKRVGKVTEELEEKITEMGTPIEEVTANEVSVEVFPNRPDLLSLPNFARAVKQFLGKEGIAKFKIRPPEKDYTVTIERAVKEVRPHTVCAIAKGITFSDEKIKELIDVQEKLHNSLGRKRKKVAIGIYPLEKITLPITFTAKAPEDIIFKPLEADKEMNAKQILKNHPAGRDYAHLLEDYNTYPVFIDANNHILSLPPIINSEETGRVNETTKDLFIECSGHNLHYLQKCLNIIIATIHDMGGKIYAMNIKDQKGQDLTTPDMNYEEQPFKITDINKTLGINLGEKDIKKYLERMGTGYENRKGKRIALIPPYRTDILHWIDLVEDIAIAHGYENFEAEIPDISTIGEENPHEKTKRTIAHLLAGTGMLETSTFHLTNKKHIKKMHFDFKEFLEVEDSKTERDVLRMDLLTNLLQVISENSDAAYPQQLFEMGTVFAKDYEETNETGIKEQEHLAIVHADELISFTDMKQILDYLFKMLDKTYILEDTEDSNYIQGRVGNIIVNGKSIGHIGEIAPRVLKNWKIKTPMVALEIDLNFLFN